MDCTEMICPTIRYVRSPKDHAFVWWLAVGTDYLGDTVFLRVLNIPYRDQTHDLSLIKAMQMNWAI